MQIFRNAELALEPAAHEEPINPGGLKKILVRKADVPAGRLQMVNWAQLKPERAFRAHYHEKMTEIFIILAGRAAIQVEGDRDLLLEGDAVVIPTGSVHTMAALDGRVVQFLAMGIAHGDGGRTVLAADPIDGAQR